MATEACLRRVAHGDPDHKVLFGLGLETGVHQVHELLEHTHVADAAGLDAYAALGFVLGATSNITAAVIMTNLLSRPAPILARTVTGLSTISGGRSRRPATTRAARSGAV
jgi:hypothetical protein